MEEDGMYEVDGPVRFPAQLHSACLHLACDILHSIEDKSQLLLRFK